MAPTFGTGDNNITLTDTVWYSVNSSRSYRYESHRHTEIRKSAPFETDQQKRDRISLSKSRNGQFQMNQVKPNIHRITSKNHHY